MGGRDRIVLADWEEAMFAELAAGLGDERLFTRLGRKRGTVAPSRRIAGALSVVAHLLAVLWGTVILAMSSPWLALVVAALIGGVAAAGWPPRGSDPGGPRARPPGPAQHRPRRRKLL